MNSTTTTTEDSRSSAEIKEDIEHVRGNMDDTLDRLNERLSPRALVNGALDWFDSRKSSAAASSARRTSLDVLDFVRDHPLPVLLTGAGVAWLIAEASRSDDDANGADDHYPARRRALLHNGGPRNGGYRPPYPDEDQDGAASAESNEPGLMEKMKDKASEVGDAIGDAADSAKTKVGGVADDLKSRADSARGSMNRGMARGKQRGQRLSSQLHSGYDEAEGRFKDAVEDYPLAVGAGFLGLGLLAGMLLPRTDAEDDLLGEASDEFADAAKEKGEDLMERGKAVAEKVADKAMAEAEKQGLTVDSASGAAQGLGAKLGEVIGAAKEEASQAAKDENLTSKDLQREASEAGAKVKDSAAEKAKQVS